MLFPPSMSTDQSISTVCRITAKANTASQGWVAQGVFVSPRRVLTNWHAVKGATGLEFTNILGMPSVMRPASEGGKHFFDADMDVALVELKYPIGSEIALPPRGLPPFRSAFNNARAVLKTCFKDKPALHEVGYSMREGMGHPNYKNMMPFRAAVKVEHGYSGSPIFAEDGMTLLSIITAFIPEEQERALRLRHAFQPLVKAHAPLQQAPDIPFMAVRPDLLANWYRKVEQELGI